MARRKKNTSTDEAPKPPPSTTIVYRSTAREPIENLDLVEQLLYLGHRYKNKLVELELARRDRYHEIVGQDPAVQAAGDEVRLALQAYEAVKGQVNDDRKLTRRRSPAASTPATNHTAKVARDLLKAKERAFTAAEKRAASREPYKSQLKVATKASFDAEKAARQASGLEGCWGTYLKIADAVSKTGRPPKYKRWDRGGQLAVQFQKSDKKPAMTVGALLGGKHTFARLDLRDDWGTTRRASRYGILWLRVGSNPSRKPVWTRIPIFYDRQIPANAEISWIQLVRTRNGNKLHWSVSITVSIPGASVERKPLITPTTLPNAIAVDFGWRTRASGAVRVAYAFDGQKSWEIALPPWVIDGYEIKEDLRSIQDRNFDAIRERVLAHLKTAQVQQEVRDALDFLPRSRSPNRLTRAVEKWVKEWQGVPDWLVAWRLQHRHLYQWERDLERSLINWRTNWYRAWALWMARNYDHVLLENVEIARIRRRPEIGEEGIEAVGKHVPASPGILREQIWLTCRREGIPVHMVPAPYTTMTCAVCGHLGLTKTELLLVECSHCGVVHDQDNNAGRILHSYATNGMVNTATVGAGVPASPWYMEMWPAPARVRARLQRLQRMMPAGVP